jgi:hypothetical protein
MRVLMIVVKETNLTLVHFNIQKYKTPDNCC